MSKTCILCGKPLSEQKTNREHYVPNTLIRNFNTVRVPGRFDHALRVDLRSDGGEITLAPISQHKQWATVVVHEKCNSDAAHMCQDLKTIISNPHNYPAHKENSIREYYAHIWGLSESDMLFQNLTDEFVDRAYSGQDYIKVYEPGCMWVGKIYIGHDASSIQSYEQHTIFLGTKKALKKLVNGFQEV